MNFRKQMVIIALVLLLPLFSFAQDCKATVYLDTQTVKAGEDVSIVAGVINGEPGKQFVIEKDGRVTFHAASRIELNDGFKALSGSGLTANVAPCNPGTEPEPSVVFPNPTDGILNVKAAYKVSAVRVSDMSGLLQFEKTDVNDTAFSLDLTKLKPGYYILEIIAEKSVTESIRIEKK